MVSGAKEAHGIELGRSILEEIDKGTHLDAIMIETTGRTGVESISFGLFKGVRLAFK